jgi:ketosteroid isomerase-like protein
VALVVARTDSPRSSCSSFAPGTAGGITIIQRNTLEKIMNAALQKACEEFSQGNMKLSFAHLAEDVRWNIVGNKTVTGIEGVQQLCEEASVHGSPVFTLTRIISDADHTVIEGTGDSEGAHGKDMDNRFCDIFNIENDKIVEITSYFISSSR